MDEIKKMPWMFIHFVVSMSALVISLVSLWANHQPVIATIDLGSIIAKTSHVLAASHPKGEISQAVLNRFVQHMKETIHIFGQENNLFIISKQALLSGESQDVSKIIEDKLMLEKKGGSSDVH